MRVRTHNRSLLRSAAGEKVDGCEMLNFPSETSIRVQCRASSIAFLCSPTGRFLTSRRPLWRQFYSAERTKSRHLTLPVSFLMGSDLAVTLTTLDYVIFGACLLVIVGLSLWSLGRKRAQRKIAPVASWPARSFHSGLSAPIAPKG